MTSTDVCKAYIHVTIYLETCVIGGLRCITLTSEGHYAGISQRINPFSVKSMGVLGEYFLIFFFLSWLSLSQILH